MIDDPSEKIEGQQPETSAEPRRLSLLDVFEQQIRASRAQALATVAACDGALTTVDLMREQIETARKAADDRRAEEARRRKEPPATFGAKARERARENQSTGGTDGHA